MLNNEQDLQRLVANLPIDTHVDPAHKQATRQRMLEQFAQAQRPPRPGEPLRALGWVRRLPMKVKSIGAVAAVLAIAAGILAVIYFGGGSFKNIVFQSDRITIFIYIKHNYIYIYIYIYIKKNVCLWHLFIWTLTNA